MVKATPNKAAPAKKTAPTKTSLSPKVNTKPNKGNAPTKMNQADLCSYSLSKDKIIKKITVHVPSEPFRGTEYSQRSKKHNRLYFLRQDDNEYIQSFYYDMITGRVAECGIPDNRIKSFTISEQGDRLAVIEYPDGGHVRVYKLDE